MRGRYGEMTIKVAGVLSNQRLVLNVGESKGSEIGDMYEIYAKDAISVFDPDTGEELGKIDDPKAAVRVVAVKADFSICEAFFRAKVNRGPIFDDTEYRPAKFAAADDAYISEGRVGDNAIRIGDIAKFIGPLG